jgi:predicted metalloprotease with PDZ domain
LTPIDYNKYLQYAGYQIKDELARRNDPAVGFAVTNINGHLVITSVARGSSAWIDGLNVNDEITGLNGSTVTSLDGILNDKNPGDKMTFNINRDGLPMVIPVTILKSNRVKYNIEEVPNVSSQQLVVRKKWLKL